MNKSQNCGFFRASPGGEPRDRVLHKNIYHCQMSQRDPDRATAAAPVPVGAKSTVQK